MIQLSEREVVMLVMIFITTVWALSATLIAVHLTGRRSIIRWVIDDVRRTFRGDA
nr:hypothetical protein [uncultured Shinella sp.]